MELRSLCDDPKATLSQAQLNHFKAWLAARDGRYLDYCWAKLKSLAVTGPGAVLAAFLIAATWMLILSNRRPVGPMLAAFSLGFMAALFLLGPLHGLLWRTDRLLFENSLGYLFTHVGLVEELVKLAPLPLLWRLGKMREPADWVVYGCLSGLGFATEENLHYFNQPYFDGALWRFLLCVPGHMFTTALIGYAWARSVPLRPDYRLMACLTTLILVSFCHALYDYAGPYQVAIGLLEALCLGRLLQTIAGINLPRGLSHSVLPCALVLLALTYWQIHLSLDTDMANNWLACNVAVLFLLPAFWYTLEFTSGKAGQPRIRLALSLLALSGAYLVLTQALPSPLCLWMLPGAGVLSLVIVSVHFGGAYALWLRQPGPAPSSCELDSLGFTPLPWVLREPRERIIGLSDGSGCFGACY